MGQIVLMGISWRASACERTGKLMGLLLLPEEKRHVWRLVNGRGAYMHKLKTASYTGAQYQIGMTHAEHTQAQKKNQKAKALTPHRSPYAPPTRGTFRCPRAPAPPRRAPVTSCALVVPRDIPLPGRVARGGFVAPRRFPQPHQLLRLAACCLDRIEALARAAGRTGA
jgi:hypothetical protein